MAFFRRADVPQSVGTYEQLAVWCFDQLQRMTAGRPLPLVPLEKQVPVFSSAVIEADDGRCYALLQGFPPLHFDSLNSSGGSLWLAAGSVIGAQNPQAPDAPPPPPPPTETDPHWASVVLLVGMTGTDGSSSFSDSGPLNLGVTATRATITSTSALVGTSAALLVPGPSNDGSWIDVEPSSALQLSGDFTIEFWHKDSAIQTVPYQTLFELGTYADGILYRSDSLWISGAVITWEPESYTTDRRHVLIQRKQGQFQMFYNGTERPVSALTITATLNTGGAGLRIGASRHTTGQFMLGLIGQFRITSGLARATGPFTPPALPFPVG